MSVAYFDSSALVKRYVAEIGSQWVQSFLALGGMPTIFISHLTAVEVACAFARRRREGALTPEEHAQVLLAFDHDFTHRYNALDVVPRVIEAAKRLANQHPLRAYDAVQLASASLANEELTRSGQPPLIFVCADDRLLTMAQGEGLLVDNPNRHP